MQIDLVGRTLEWIKQHGGSVAAGTEIRQDAEHDLSVYSTSPVPADTRLISCPFTLAITPDLATAAIKSLLGKGGEMDLVWPANSSHAGEPWSERMRISSYVVLHRVWMEDEHVDIDQLPSELRHGIYIASLPADSDLTTPLYFTNDELELLSGTNLAGAVEDRRKEWKEEAEAVRAVLGVQGLTWERYLAAATYLSSRGFPSSLLRLPTTSSESTSTTTESHPVLLPGLDLYNHSRGQPIVWLSSETPSSLPSPTPTISLVTTQSHDAGVQLFNNYGPKSNEELLLGYGFVLADNPDDTVSLKLGTKGLPPAVNAALESKQLRQKAESRFILRRDGKLDPELLAVLRVIVSGGAEEENEDDIDPEDEHALHAHEERGMQLEMDVLGTLGQMLDDKLAKLDQGRAEDGSVSVRPRIARMCEIYRRGQVDVLNSAMDGISERIERLEGMLDQGMGGCACCS